MGAELTTVLPAPPSNSEISEVSGRRCRAAPELADHRSAHCGPKLSAARNALSLMTDAARYDFEDKAVDWCLRLSPRYYSTEGEVDAVAAVVAELAHGGQTAEPR
jgi:selenocysteine lyase/cysteine desulfurase